MTLEAYFRFSINRRLHSLDLYISAGLLSDMYRLDPVKLSWTNMNLCSVNFDGPSARKGHGLASLGMLLFVYGGYGNSGMALPVQRPSDQIVVNCVQTALAMMSGICYTRYNTCSLRYVYLSVKLLLVMLTISHPTLHGRRPGRPLVLQPNPQHMVRPLYRIFGNKSTASSISRFSWVRRVAVRFWWPVGICSAR